MPGTPRCDSVFSLLASSVAQKDVTAVLRHVHELYPKAPLFALAFSLGANLLLHALSDDANQLSFLSGAGAIGGPWNLLSAADVLEKGLSRLLFSAPLARGLVEYAQRNAKVWFFFLSFVLCLIVRTWPC